jgi:hypothetical protein
MRYSFGAVLVAAALVAFIASCGEETEHYEYEGYSYIDTIHAPDTIVSGDPVEIVYYLPGGCNRFERFETEERGDTLEVSVVVLFYFYGMPCVHGPVYGAESFPLSFSTLGPKYLLYRRQESEWIVQDVYVR